MAIVGGSNLILSPDPMLALSMLRQVVADIRLLCNSADLPDSCPLTAAATPMMKELMALGVAKGHPVSF